MRALCFSAAIAFAVASLGSACAPPATENGGKKSKDEDDEEPKEPKADPKNKKAVVPPPRPIEDERVIRALEAEVAALKRQIAEGHPPASVPGLINAHEHLYKLADLEKYLPAARQAGITATVVVSSSNFTLSGSGSDKGEPGMSENFKTVLEASKKYPGEIIPFCTIDPKDPDKLDRLKEHIKEGCKGLKIYSGHSNFYDGPLEPPDMTPVLDYLEETQLPVNWHVNLAKFMDEFEVVADKHPKLNLMVPHYGVTFWKPLNSGIPRLSAIMRKHKNIIVDTSLGTREILLNGMSAMEPAKDKFLAFFTEFQDQIIWGTDSVITANNEKTPSWYSKVIWATRDHLEKDVFSTDLAAAYSKYYEKGRDGEGRYQGLSIPPAILQKVYVDNARRWLGSAAPPLKAAPTTPAPTTPAPTTPAPTTPAPTK